MSSSHQNSTTRQQQPRSKRKRRSPLTCLFSLCLGGSGDSDSDSGSDGQQRQQQQQQQQHHDPKIDEKDQTKDNQTHVRKNRSGSLALVPKDTLQEVHDQMMNGRHNSNNNNNTTLEPTSTGHSSRDRCHDDKDEQDDSSSSLHHHHHDSASAMTREEQVFASRNYHTQDSKPSTIDEVQCTSSPPPGDEELSLSSTNTSTSSAQEHALKDEGEIVDQQHEQEPGTTFESTTSAPPVNSHHPLLPPKTPSEQAKKCLVLDLDETLVHSSFKSIPDADFVIPVDIDNIVYNVYVIKRPGVDEFLLRVGQIYEVVVFTASVSKYGDPLLDQLDPNHLVHHRLFRESCSTYQGNYVKDLSLLGRPLKDIIIVDNSPPSYILQPQHAVPVSSWFSDVHDNELLDMLPILQDLSTHEVPDVSLILDVSLG